MKSNNILQFICRCPLQNQSSAVTVPLMQRGISSHKLRLQSLPNADKTCLPPAARTAAAAAGWPTDSMPLCCPMGKAKFSDFLSAPKIPDATGYGYRECRIQGLPTYLKEVGCWVSRAILLHLVKIDFAISYSRAGLVSVESTLYLGTGDLLYQVRGVLG